MFYFGQVIVFCRLINKNLLEWFLLIYVKNIVKPRSTNLFGRNHPTMRFWLTREGRNMPITGQVTLLKHGVIIRTDKSSHRRFSIRKSCSQKFCNIHRRTHERKNVLNELHFLCNENVLMYTIWYNSWVTATGGARGPWPPHFFAKGRFFLHNS